VVHSNKDPEDALRELESSAPQNWASQDSLRTARAMLAGLAKREAIVIGCGADAADGLARLLDRRASPDELVAWVMNERSGISEVFCDDDVLREAWASARSRDR
jgi:hypothetical protein